MIGRVIGPYRVQDKLGEGGMGQVYRATDTKLKRQVAIKILPASVAGDHDRLARFQREAEVLASLNHPHISSIYGLEESEGSTALIMELVEGDDLSALIARGPLPLADALPIARQIAEALEAAHEQGIVHRDLKPANIKLKGVWGPTPTRLSDGRLEPTLSASDVAGCTVKVLDFGLAKAMDPVGASSADAMNSPTLTARATQMGVILGTAAYMAPEQARGRVVDKRADIWAFGVVVFEMLTGTRAFPGDDITDTIVSVVSKEPDWSALPAETPPGLRRLLTRCLKKDPRARLRDIGDARLQIEELIAGTPDDSAPAASIPAAALAPAPQPSAGPRVLPWAAAGVLAVALGLALWAPWRGASAPQSAAMRLTPLSFEPGGQIGAVWSPDGKAVAYGARQSDTDPYQVYVRYLDSPVATQITTAAGVQVVVAWTTAGKIVFWDGQQLWSVSPVGGEPEPVSLTPTAAGAKLQVVGSGSISRDGTVVAGPFLGADGVFGVWTISAGSLPMPYEPAPFASRSTFNNPSVTVSPDGKRILLLRNAGAGEEAWLMPYPANAAAPPRRILQGVSAFTSTPTAAWMPDNRHVVLSATPSAAPRQLYLADTVSGTLTIISSGTAGQNAPAVSPDGSKLAFVEATFDRDVVSVDLATAVVTPVIETQRSEQMPAWAAKEPALVYVTDRNGDHEIWLRKPGQPDRPLVTSRDFPPGRTRGFMAPALSPDGTRVIYAWLELGGLAQLWMSAVAGGPPVRLVRGEGSETPGSWSPDGNWYVYRQLGDGRESLNKVKTTGGAEPEVLKPDVRRSGSWVPVWSPANDWILHGDGGVKLVSPDGKTTRDVSPTSALAYAFSADGRTIYGLRQPAAFGRVELFSMSVAGGAEKTIGSATRDYLPVTSFSPALRLSLTPDGKSLTYSTLKTTSNLWLMDGLTSVMAR